jgi:hypothetical protein
VAIAATASATGPSEFGGDNLGIAGGNLGRSPSVTGAAATTSPSEFVPTLIGGHTTRASFWGGENLVRPGPSEVGGGNLGSSRFGDGPPPLHGAAVGFAPTTGPSLFGGGNRGFGGGNLERLTFSAGSASTTGPYLFVGGNLGPLPDPWRDISIYLAAQDDAALQAQDDSGLTPLLVAAERGASLDVLYELLITFPDDFPPRLPPR